MSKRQSEMAADRIDFMIYDAISRIGRILTAASEEPDRLAAWRDTLSHLRNARSSVQPLMNPERARETER
jgi:hypothetical protein